MCGPFISWICNNYYQGLHENLKQLIVVSWLEKYVKFDLINSSSNIEHPAFFTFPLQTFLKKSHANYGISLICTYDEFKTQIDKINNLEDSLSVVLDSFLSTWYNLELSEMRAPQIEQMSLYIWSGYMKYS